MNSQCFIQKWCRIVLETQGLKLQMPRIFTRYLEAGAPVKREGDALMVQLGKSHWLLLLLLLFGPVVWGPVVWGTVVWIPRIPENERDCDLGVPLESQTTGPQTNN